jgi:hypothetical protein
MTLPTSGVAAETAPDVFKGGALLRWDPYPILTGTAYSSHPPATTYFHNVVLQDAVQIANINVVKSMNASVPDATSAASTGSEGYSYQHGVTIFRRQDYGANFSNLTTVATGSFGLTASVGYSSTSQSLVLQWVTNTSGGASTFTFTSNNGGWSSFLTGPKFIAIPFAAYLSAGEYFIAHGHSSTSATSNSNVTLLSFSNLHMAPQLNTLGLLGGSVTNATAVAYGSGNGVASAVTTNATMPGSVVSGQTVNQWVHNFSGI